MPPNCVKVDRSTKWGNPFIVGVHGTRAYCVQLFRYLCAGKLCISVDIPCVTAQEKFMAHALANRERLRGKDLACWCSLNAPCHADTILSFANNAITQPGTR